MITPRFELQQDDEFIIITVKAPYTKVPDTEIYMEGTDFIFSSKPYYLRLVIQYKSKKANFLDTITLSQK